MKKSRVSLAFLTLLFTVACIFPTAVYAEETKMDHDVSVQVEYVMGSEILNEFTAINIPRSNTGVRSSVIDLSDGADTVAFGALACDQVATTSVYSITKTKIKVALMSMRINSPNVRVTLYASNGQPLASQNVSIPAFSTISLTGATVTFTNLNSATHYYIEVKNLDTASTGDICGTVSQA